MTRVVLTRREPDPRGTWMRDEVERAPDASGLHRLEQLEKLFVSGATITGWLFSTKSCDVAPGVRFCPGTDTRIDMPRTSRSRSEADAALAKRM